MANDKPILIIQGQFDEAALKKKLQSQLESVSKTLGKANSRTTLFNAQIKEVTKQTDKAAKSIDGMTNSIAKDIKKVAEWGVSTALIYGSLRKIGEGVTFIKELDTAMSEVRMASSLTKEETDKLAVSYNQLGKELGISTKQIAESAVNLYRQGLSTEEVNARLADYIKLSKVAGEELQKTIEMGTAATTIFDVSVKKLGDSASAVGDSVASSTLEIMQAIQKSGSSAQTAGVQLEELEAMAAVIGSTTRESGAVIGNSLKSLFAKLSQVDDMTGEINDDYSKTLKRVADLGIAIESQSGSLLDATDILKNIGNKWDDLSEQEKKYLSSGFGVYQLNRFSALVKGMSGEVSQYDKVLQVAYDSTGAMDTKYNEYSNTIEAANERLKASWESLYIDTIESGFMISLANAGGTIIEFVKDTNALQTALLSLSATFVALNLTALSKFITMIISGTQYLIAFKLEVLALIPTVGLLMGGIALATGGLLLFNYQQTKYIENQKIATQKTEESSKAMFENEKSAKTLMASIVDLSDAKNLDATQTGKLKSVISEMQKMYPGIFKNMDTEKMKLKDIIEAYNAVGKSASQAQVAKLLADRRMAESDLKQAYASRGPQGLAVDSGKIAPSDDAKTKAIKSRINSTNKLIQEAMSYSDNYTPVTIEELKGMNGSSSSATGGNFIGGEDDKKKTSRDILDFYKKQEDALRKTSNEMEILNGKIEVSEGQARIDLQNKQITNMLKLRGEYHDYAEAIRVTLKTEKLTNEEKDKLNDKLADLQKNYISTTNDVLKLRDANKDLTAELKKQREDAYDALQDQVEKNIEADKELKLKQAENWLEDELLKKEQSIFGMTKDRWDIVKDDGIDLLEKELDLLEESEKIEENKTKLSQIQLELDKQKLKLAEVTAEKNVQLYVKGEGFQWVADPRKVQEESEKLSSIQSEYDSEMLSQTKEATKQKKQIEINTLKETNDAKEREYKLAELDLTTTMNNTKNTIIQNYADIGSLVNQEMQKYYNLGTAQLQKALEDAIAYGNAIKIALAGGTPTTPTTTTSGRTTSSATSSSTYESSAVAKNGTVYNTLPTTYDKNVDYAAKIQDALKSGDVYSAQVYTAQRNLKVADMTTTTKSSSGSSTTIINVGTVKTNDSKSFVDNLKKQVN